MAANAHAIFAPQEWVIEIMQKSDSEPSFARALSMNVRRRTPAYATEYFHSEFAATTRTVLDRAQSAGSAFGGTARPNWDSLTSGYSR